MLFQCYFHLEMDLVPWSDGLDDGGMPWSDGLDDVGSGGDAYRGEALAVLPIRVVGIVAVERADFGSAGAAANHLLDKDVFQVRYLPLTRRRHPSWLFAVG